MTIGILAYGSLLADPGAELAEAIVERRPAMTPFPIEYARSSKGRAGAPTLVPAEIGSPVKAQILVMRPDIQEHEIQNRLYRREINRVGDQECLYDDAAQRSKENAVVIKALRDLAGVPTVFYTSLKANIPEVLSAGLSDEEKAERLAELAVASVKPETYAAGRDGIRYLDDAIRYGIVTPLTELYRAAILRRAGDAPDLEEARLRIARQNDIKVEEGQ